MVDEHCLILVAMDYTITIAGCPNSPLNDYYYIKE